MWKKERFKKMKEAKLAYDALLKNSNCNGVYIYKGHREYVIRWREIEQPEQVEQVSV